MKRFDGSQPDNSNSSTPHPNVDAYFDRELTPDSIESLLSSLNRSESQHDQFHDTQSMLDDLRSPIETPDISGRILGEVGDRRGWLSTGGRRLVLAGRLATAACLLLVVTGLLLVRRSNPETFGPTSSTGPVSEIVEAGSVEAGASIRVLREGLLSIERHCKPAVSMAANSVSSCESSCGANRKAMASSEQDFSIALSPGVGQWLSAGNVSVTVVVSNRVRRDLIPAWHGRWLITPERNSRFPSYDATSGPRLINIADWTTPNDQGR